MFAPLFIQFWDDIRPCILGKATYNVEEQDVYNLYLIFLTDIYGKLEPASALSEKHVKGQDMAFINALLEKASR
jgi:hypothetical protein